MKAKLIAGPPPGWLTATDAAKRLSMSRQLFYQAGLADAVRRYKVGSVTLYANGDLDAMAAWLTIRRGLIALSELPGDSPLNPSEEQWYLGIEVGEWDFPCPICHGEAVGLEGDPRTWCPKCGISE